MIVSIDTMFHLIFCPWVALEAAAASVAITFVAWIAFNRGWKGYYWVYGYEILLVLLYGHFLFGSPPKISTDFISMVYWTLLVSTMLLVGAPLFLEWRELARLCKRKKKRHSKLRLLCGWAIATLLCTFVLYLLLTLCIDTINRNQRQLEDLFLVSAENSVCEGKSEKPD